MADKRALAPRRRSRTRYAVLGMLSLGLETGYAMKKHVEGNLSHFWQESYGQIYPVLRQLEEEGLVRRRRAPAGAGPRRNAYVLTARGERELSGWLAEAPEPPIPRMELLLKLSFGDQADVGVCAHHVREHRALCERDLAFFDELEPALDRAAQSERSLAFGLLTLRYGRLLREAELRWCDEALERLTTLDRGHERARTGESRR
ncbi:MAG: PadR family transcriptional regulator [Myxococcota bacterium]